MEQAPGQSGAHVIGREPELVQLHDFLSVDSPLRALVLTGGPGMGKTTLWEAAIEAADPAVTGSSRLPPVEPV